MISMVGRLCVATVWWSGTKLSRKFIYSLRLAKEKNTLEFENNRRWKTRFTYERLELHLRNLYTAVR